MRYSWHMEHYRAALKKLSAEAKQAASEADSDIRAHIGQCGMWDWFASRQPKAYEKYLSVCARLDELFRKKDSTPDGMEEFKKTVKLEMDAMLWAFKHYLADLSRQKEAA